MDTSATSTATGNLRCYGFVTFGAFYYAPPSGMLIPANTLVWTNFQYGQNVSLNLQAQVNIFAYADDSGTNLTIGIYGPNGSLLATSATSFPADVCQMSSPNCTNTPNGTANQIMPIPNSPLVDGFNVDAYNVSILQGSTFSVVFTASHAVWMEGWSFADRSGGTGAKYGQFAWEVPITYEASGQYTTLPALLPQASFTSSFEMGIWGRTTIQVPST